MKVYSRSNSGFISTYFLSIFMYVSLLSSLIVINLSDRSKTMINLSTYSEYFIVEAQVIEELKCMLLKEEELPYERIGNTIYIAITDPIREDLIVTIDPITNHVMDYSVTRYEVESIS